MKHFCAKTGKYERQEPLKSPYPPFQGGILRLLLLREKGILKLPLLKEDGILPLLKGCWGDFKRHFSKKLALISLIIVYFVCILMTSTTHAAFENVELGARPLAMGSAFTAVADDASGIFWNPAGLSQIENREIIMSYMELYDLVSYSSLGYVQNMKIATIGVGLVSSSDVDGVYQDMIISLSGAKEVLSNLSLGANAKYLYSSANIENMKIGSGKGISLDVGLQYHMQNDLVKIGVALQNLVGNVSYNRKEIKYIPGEKYWQRPGFSYKAGVALNPGNVLPQLGRTFIASEFSDGDFHSGAEYVFRDVLALRAGFMAGNALTRAITIGFGLKLQSIKLDYAYVSSHVGTPTSQFSVSIEW